MALSDSNDGTVHGIMGPVKRSIYNRHPRVPIQKRSVVISGSLRDVKLLAIVIGTSSLACTM
jgi:hypothetical protein